MQTSTEFNQRADQTLHQLQDRVESFLESADVDLLDETLTIILESGQQYIINKHNPTQQIWVASPTSGAHHFGFEEQTKVWINVRNGQELNSFLEGELRFYVA